MVRNMRVELEGFLDSVDTGDVTIRFFIERQPGFVKWSGHFLQGAAAMFAEAHGYSVRLVNPQQHGKTYKQRKDAAVEFVAEEVVGRAGTFPSWFLQQKKRDDLADAYILAKCGRIEV